MIIHKCLSNFASLNHLAFTVVFNIIDYAIELTKKPPQNEESHIIRDRNYILNITYINYFRLAQFECVNDITITMSNQLPTLLASQ